MERKTYLISVDMFARNNLNDLPEKLQEGWTLDPLFKSNPIKLDSVAIYHLIKYSDEEKLEMESKLLEATSEEAGKYGDVCDAYDAKPEEVAAKYAEGFRVEESYAKVIRMFKRTAKEDPVFEAELELDSDGGVLIKRGGNSSISEN